MGADTSSVTHPTLEVAHVALADDLREEEATPFRRSCGVATLLEELEPDDREVITAALANSKLPSTGIERALLKNGHEVGIATIQRHRRGACKCGRVS